MVKLMHASAVCVFAVCLLLFGCFGGGGEQLSEEQVKQLITEDLRANHPKADVISIVSTELKDGSWKVKGRVTYNSSTQCPERIHVTYDYPRFGFVPNPPEYITSNCLACAGAKECKIAFEEQAIIASHTFTGANEVSQFVYTHPDAVASAGAYDNYFHKTQNKTYSNIWLVEWSSPTTDTSYKTLLDKNTGTILNVEQR